MKLVQEVRFELLPVRALAIKVGNKRWVIKDGPVFEVNSHWSVFNPQELPVSEELTGME